jgi:hypothetical protein
MIANINWNIENNPFGIVGAGPDHDPKHPDYTGCNNTLHHGGENILPVNHTAIEKRQSGRHQEYQRRSNQHPGNICRNIFRIRDRRRDTRDKNGDNSHRRQDQER